MSSVVLNQRLQILLVEARLHDLHALRVGRLDEAESLLRRAGEPGRELVLLGEEDRAALVIDGAVSVFGSVVMKQKTSMSTLGPSFLIGPFHCR